MRGLKKVPSEKDEGAPPSSSMTRSSSSHADVMPPTSEDVDGPGRTRVYRRGDVVDGRYVLIDQLGKGGMGVVWKARSTALDVEVAVKLVRRSNSSSDSFKRMAREAHAAARLGHPAMATVLDFGATPDGDPYVVMELLRGESLGEVLGRERRVDPLRAVGTLLPIIDGLREAHDKGIVHRDLKPENLFISKAARGRLQPKVLDFGIAKLELPSDSSRLTQDGTVLGSPGYFSPEQARGETNLDFRTDIWSISVVLYELITGELPFNGPNYNALLMSILKDTPTSIVAHGYGDEALWAIVQKGLQRDRNKRWSSMWELGRALASWLHDKGILADLASRSIKEVWLEPRHASEAPGPQLFETVDGPRRGVLSTFIKRRASDTLAGETVSTAATQRRVPARLIGWGAAVGGALVLVWSALIQGRTAPSAHAAAQPASNTELGAGESAPRATVPPPMPSVGAGPAPPPQGDAVAAKGSLGGRPAPEAALRAASAKDDRFKTSAPSRSKLAEPPVPKVHKAAPVATSSAKPTRPIARKRIDQEFGF
jgi:serine/threonine protein kinase